MPEKSFHQRPLQLCLFPGVALTFLAVIVFAFTFCGQTFAQTNSTTQSNSTPPNPTPQANSQQANSPQANSTQANSPQADFKTVPVIDGGIGPCSADFVITDSAGAPVYAAKIAVHIAYGFMNVRKLDLQLSTNADGKARVTGLPDHIKHGIYFHASEGDRVGEAFDDPANTCKAQLPITLRQKE
jgi:hypothetical protein